MKKRSCQKLQAEIIEPGFIPKSYPTGTKSAVCPDGGSPPGSGHMVIVRVQELNGKRFTAL
jgi:hypothetical protein